MQLLTNKDKIMSFFNTRLSWIYLLFIIYLFVKVLAFTLMVVKILDFNTSKSYFIYFTTSFYNTPNIKRYIFFTTSFKII